LTGITGTSYDKRMLTLLLGLGLLYFAFNLWIAPYLIFNMPISAYRISRDLTNLALVLPILLLGRSQVSDPRPKKLLTSVLFIVGTCIFTALVENYYRGSLIERTSLVGVGGGMTQPEVSSPYILTKILLVTPIIEEIVFRLAFIGLLSRFVGKFPSLLISSALFAVAHLTRVDWVGLPPYLLSGLMYGITYMLLGLRWSVLLHILSNSLSYAVSEGYYAQATESDAIFLPYLLIVVAGFAVMVREIIRDRKELIK
jgi:membrane protease YdiL (CAAX protease family)